MDTSILNNIKKLLGLAEDYEAFDIDIDVDDLEPENFNTVKAMWELIRSYQE